MEKKILFEIPAMYRDDFRITGYSFGTGEKSACVVGNMRGNENQQLYTCSKLIQALKKIEESGLINKGKEILVVPSVNTYSMNTKKRFWSIDNTDINRMFPGYDQGETTQRIAAGLFGNISDYEFGVQFASFYMPGNFMPHARVMSIGDKPDSELLDLAKDFGLPYVVSHEPRPYDTATLNYNWQVWESKAFSIYTTTTDEIDKDSAIQAVRAIITFLGKQGIINYIGHEGYISKIVSTKDIITVRAKSSGFFDSFVKAGDVVRKNQVLAEITHSYEGNVIDRIVSNVDGVILFARNGSKMYANTAVYKIIPENPVY
ncbi:MAG: M14 family metallopeptidase [Clostridia bacterium]